MQRYDYIANVLMYPIHEAIQNDDFQRFDAFIRNMEIDINVRDSEQETPLHYCINLNRNHMALLLLLRRDIQVNLVNNVSE